MAVLKSTNVQGSLCVNGVAVGGGGKDFKFYCFTSSDTWTPPSDLVTGDGVVDTFVVGAGGGGGAVAYHANCACARGIAAGAGAGGGIDHKNVIVSSSNDACTIAIGGGGNSGSISTAFSVFSICSAMTPATAGGNSTALGIKGFGGGAGAMRACSDGRFDICCNVNTFNNGPIGGQPWITARCNITQWTCYACEGYASQGGTCIGGDFNSVDTYTSLGVNGCRVSSTNAALATFSCFKSQNYKTRNRNVIFGTSCLSSGSAMGCTNPSCYNGKHQPTLWNDGAYGANINGEYFGVGASSPCNNSIIPGQSHQINGDNAMVEAQGFGYGGAGAARTMACNSSCAVSQDGVKGTNGIVILKWME